MLEIRVSVRKWDGDVETFQVDDIYAMKRKKKKEKS